LLDPNNPQDLDPAILKRLCLESNTPESFIRNTEILGGRWILFFSGHGSEIVFNDAGGTRTIFYHLDTNKSVWMATQPGLLAEKFGFTESSLSMEYTRSEKYQKRNEAWWPGECSPFSEVKQLLPNHFFDLKTKTTLRYWPYQTLEHLELDKAVSMAGDILKGLLASAHHRFQLALSLSSGLDSRLVMSACKDVIEDVQVFSLLYRNLTIESDDVFIPIKISSELGIKHSIYDCRPESSSEFKEIFKKHVVGLKTDWVNIAAGRMANIPADKVILKGTISEIMRCRYWGVGIYPPRVTLQDIVTLMSLGDSPLVVENLRAWMKEAKPSEKFGIKLLDLLSWEVEVGSWYDMGYAIFNIAQEEFTLFNCRRFFTIMLGIDPKYRSYPVHVAQRRIIAYLWPELDNFPYTPHRNLPTRKFSDSGLYYYLRLVKRSVFNKKKIK
jgi:hypothetical protein